MVGVIFLGDKDNFSVPTLLHPLFWSDVNLTYGLQYLQISYHICAELSITVITPTNIKQREITRLGSAIALHQGNKSLHE